MPTRSSALRTILDALEQPRTCFVLGAGASAPIVPMAAQLGARVRKRLLSIGIFPTETIPRDIVSDRILSPFQVRYAPFDVDTSLQEELIARHVSPAAVHAAAAAELRPEPPQVAPSQYAVFGLSRHRLSMINFNVDGLADRFCGNHRVVNIHGSSLAPKRRREIGWEGLIDGFQEFPEIPPLRIPGLLLPQPEPAHIRTTTEYGAARVCLRSANRLVLVGYAFGSMDDRQAYDLITNAIRLRRLRTVVLTPAAEDLAARLQVESSTDDVLPFSGYWDKLSLSIMSSIGRPRRKSCNHACLCLDCVNYYYEALLDSWG